MFIVNFIFGILIVGGGILMLHMNFQIANLFGRNNIFERKLGSGSTYFMLKLLALLTIFFGFLMAFSLHDNLFKWLLDPIIDSFN